jgi:hypothetical protein
VMLLQLLVFWVGVAQGQRNNVASTGIQGTITVSPTRPGPAKK